MLLFSNTSHHDWYDTNENTMNFWYITAFWYEKTNNAFINFDNVRISSLYIRIDSLYLRTGICRLSAATQYNAQRSHCHIGSHIFALVSVSSYLFLSCSDHILAHSYWFSITTVLHLIASCSPSCCILLHLTASYQFVFNSCLIRIDLQIIIVSNCSGSA